MTLLIGAGVLLVALAVAARVRRRRPESPPRDQYPIPRQLDRADFARPDAAWLVAYFSSDACASCQGLGPRTSRPPTIRPVACRTST